jgi:lysophospholipase L1-like esterase
MSSASARPRRLGAHVGLAVVSTLLGLGLLEVGFRARAGLAAPAGLAAVRPGRVVRGGRARLGDVVRPSANPRIVYELIPDLDVEILGVRLRTNADGFRGEAVSPSRSRPAVRVVGLGDSVMFGWGVREEDSYLARAAAMLQTSSPGVAWEVVNTAVPGYNTVMEVETLETKGLRFDPDLVVLNFVGNDLGLPNFLEQRPDVWSLRRSFLVEFVRGRLRGEPEAGPRLVGVPTEVRRFGEAHLDRVPPRYRGLLGPVAWRSAMERLRTLSRNHGFEVVILAHPEAFGFVREAARELGFPLVETGDAVRAWAREHGLDDIQTPPLTLTDADPHPSAVGHEIIARALADFLRGCGLAERMASRRRPGPGAARPAP